MRILLTPIAAVLLLTVPAWADVPRLESSSPRITVKTLDETSKEILEQGRIGDRPGQRLFMACDDRPLPPGWQPGTPKTQFAWSCSVKWEHRLPVGSGALWAPTAMELWNGRTDSQNTGLKEELKSRLAAFFKIKPQGSGSTGGGQ